MMNGKELSKLVRKLQIVAPALLPVSVTTRGKLGGGYGTCEIIKRKGEPRIKITINSFKDFSKEEVVDILQTQLLIHEYAHATQWRVPRQEVGRASDHDSEFGVHYAKIYKLLGMAD